jgi:hypothetical protein
MDERQPPDDLARFMEAYTEAWNAGDLDGIVGACATPCFMVTVRWICRRPGGSTIWNFLDSYPLAIEEGQWRILGDAVHR